jgi:Yip1-like protein
MTHTHRLTFGFFALTLTRILGEPRRYFSECWVGGDVKRPLVFLIGSSLFYALAGTIQALPPNPVLAFSILFLNATGMVLITVIVAYTTAVTIFGRQHTFGDLFSIIALCSGVTLLASWVPFFIWITEPWKWWLIWVGFVHGCGFKRWQAALVSGLTLLVMVLLFWTLLPALMA